MGVCCYYAQQYPQCLRCFERALSLADSDRVRADVWYNVAIISIVRSLLAVARVRCAECACAHVCVCVCRHWAT